MSRLLQSRNEKGTYGVIDRDGKIVEKFRSKSTAREWLPKLESIYLQKLKIIALK